MNNTLGLRNCELLRVNATAALCAAPGVVVEASAEAVSLAVEANYVDGDGRFYLRGSNICVYILWWGNAL